MMNLIDTLDCMHRNGLKKKQENHKHDKLVCCRTSKRSSINISRSECTRMLFRDNLSKNAPQTQKTCHLGEYTSIAQKSIIYRR